MTGGILRKREIPVFNGTKVNFLTIKSMILYRFRIFLHFDYVLVDLVPIVFK